MTSASSPPEPDGLSPAGPCDPYDPFTHDYGSGFELAGGRHVWTCSRCGDTLVLSAEFRRRLEADRARVFADADAREREDVRQLGARIGYGNMMNKASELWAVADTGRPGGHFVVGPCASLVVPCGCEGHGICAWCCGTGWLTKRVKQAKDESEQR